MGVRLNRVTVSYGKRGGASALADVSLEFRPGEMVGVLGRSGAGKTTLIRCINALVRATSGTVEVNGRSLAGLGARELREVRSRIGMVFQQFGLVPRTTALTNVLLGAIGQRPAWRNAVGYFDAEERARALAALEAVELGGLGSRRVDQLSGGQQQRVAIARALMQRPSVLLGDEPVSSLDPVTSRGILELFARIHAEDPRRITVVNLHDPELALAYCTRIIGLREGRVVFDGPPDAVDASARLAIYGG
ncbi:phosphonate ABC transporter ATP-binding protein [Paenibacillus sp.]|uniref:phosphonate ABC transporter ATP-binding protein n=1 Tax=Paenibacillus sp. TaxID=58172 RepID=UPI002D5D64EE|nr:phosphonate ABC transporter ATP-binding protein [Paenibacillus sp.]HZG56764.1 phosphonate ABC transporter ATP-binding protein [Paenibacillus sp.]